MQVINTSLGFFVCVFLNAVFLHKVKRTIPTSESTSGLDNLQRSELSSSQGSTLVPSFSHSKTKPNSKIPTASKIAA